MKLLSNCAKYPPEAIAMIDVVYDTGSLRVEDLVSSVPVSFPPPISDHETRSYTTSQLFAEPRPWLNQRIQHHLVQLAQRTMDRRTPHRQRPPGRSSARRVRHGANRPE